MAERVQGLHHITLCTGSARGDVDFSVKTPQGAHDFWRLNEPTDS